MATQNKSKARYLDRVLVGSCYDHPSQYDVYADGSNANTSISKSNKDPSRPVEIDAPALQYVPEVYSLISEKKKSIPQNPSAGTIRAIDLGAPWMESTMVSLDEDNKAAQLLIQSKKELNLAKQACQGLKKTYNLIYDVTELAVLLKLAYQYNNKRGTDEVMQNKEIGRALSVLDGCLKYDLKKVANGLGLKIKREQTFGYIRRKTNT